MLVFFNVKLVHYLGLYMYIFFYYLFYTNLHEFTISDTDSNTDFKLIKKIPCLNFLLVFSFPVLSSANSLMNISSFIVMKQYVKAIHFLLFILEKLCDCVF